MVKSVILYGTIILFSIHKSMVEVIHSYRGFYPFGLKKQTQNTYVQILKQDLSEEQINDYREKSKIYREISNVHFVKLLKILKQENNLHFLYEYYETSLEAFIDNLRKDNDEAINRARFKAISDQFKSNIDNIIAELIKFQIKIDISLSNLAVVLKKQQGEKAVMKVFVDCDAEYLSIANHKYRPKDNKWKTLAELNNSFLRELYEADKKRLSVQFDQLLGTKLGKFNASDKKMSPNFVIIGTKLVFLNTEDNYRSTSHEDSLKNSRTENNRMSVNPKELTQKLMLDSMKNSRNDTKSAANLNYPPAAKPKIQRIVNFDQSFQPEFKPEQFTKENTYIFEQNDYLQSLEEELNKISSWKKVQQSKTSHSTEEKTIKNTSDEEMKKSKEDSNKKILGKKQSPQYGSFVMHKPDSSNNQSSSNASNSSNSPGRFPNDKMVIEPQRTEKTNKYRMKIITSHQIQIEGGQQQNAEQLEREIMEDIRSGKLNINELASSGINNSSVVKNQTINTSHEHSKNEYLITSMMKSKHSETNSKEAKEAEAYNQNKKYFAEKIENTRSSGLKQSHLKYISDLISKGGAKPQHSGSSNHDQNQQIKQVKSQHKIYTVSSYHQNKPQKAQNADHIHQKPQTTENYLNKIRQVKNRAQQILKGCGKKKQ